MDEIQAVDEAGRSLRCVLRIKCRGATATTWDHHTLWPAAVLTPAPTMVPACGPCNSSKRDR